ncbi:type II toxin-antitoxin system prevent-host-death family antitoxin [Acerihabitans sp. TG2]|uniref:type II toxin-antitoxin system prevent-host-death family antitoxin n=1 Tax=Acerihabitans sp. TG2 TaxID=3096008 RepID=UPI003A5997CA
MRTISYTALRNNLAHALESLQQGEVYCVTRRGREDLILKGETVASSKCTAEATTSKGDFSFHMEDLL